MTETLGTSAERSGAGSTNYLLAELRRIYPELARRYTVKSLALFGSYVRNEQQVGSDLDILVEFDEPPGLLKFIEMENLLSDALHVKVDLVMRDALKPRIGVRILSEAIAV